MEEQKEEIIQKEGENREENSSACSEICKKKMKNYVSIVILLSGLLVGSIFVDVAQFFGQQGVSPRALKNVDVFPFEGRTWVAFNEPVVNVKVLTDSKCEACDPTEPLKWMKRVIPTMLAKKIEIDSLEGKDLIDNYKIKSLPAFVFDENIAKTDIYQQAQAIFSKKDSSYLLDTEQVGIKAGKFLETPQAKDDDAQIGPKDAKVKVILFSDFQCPYCKTFYEQSFKKAITDYKDRALFVFKHLPLSIHDKAESSAMASECALEQGKFWEMSDKLYGAQSDWSKAKEANFAPYASAVGLNLPKFNECVSQKKYQDKIDADSKVAQDFGISGTPAFFVNDQFFGGVVSYEKMKKTLDEELGK